MANYIALGLIVSIVLIAFARDYYKGLYVSLFFMILCPPNITIEISVSMPSITIHRIIMMIMLYMWYRYRKKDEEVQIKNIPYLKILIFITLALTVSTAFSDNFLVSSKRYLYFIIESLIFYIIISSSITSHEVMLKVLKVVNLALICVGLLGFVQKYTGFSPISLFGSKLTYSFERVSRVSSFMRGDITSTYLHRILYGIAMGIGLLNSLFLIDLSENRRQKYFYWISSFILGGALYFCMSRGPWLAFLLAVVFMYLLGYKPIMKKTVIIGIFAMSALLIRPGTLSTISSLYRSTFEEATIKGASYQWRYLVLERAINNIVFSGSPITILFGYGEGSHIFMEHEPVLLPTGHWGRFESWDMEFAVILYGRGIIGIALILVFYGMYFYEAIIYHFKSHEHDYFLVLTLAAMFILTFMKTNVRIFAPQLIYLEFIFIAIGSRLIYNLITDNEESYLEEGYED